MPSIVLTSTSFTNNGLLPVNFKNHSTIAVNPCVEDNDSPQFAWELIGLVPGHIEYFNLYVEEVDLPGTGPNSGCLHWGVRKIERTQYSIAENGSWNTWAEGPDILTPDFSTATRINGWHGPCIQEGSHLSRCWVEAKIYQEHLLYLFGNNEDWPIELNAREFTLRSNYLYFQDSVTNVSPESQCGEDGVTCCTRIRDCKSGEEFLVRLADSETNLSWYYNVVYTFSQPSALQYRCWRVMGDAVCDDPDFDNLIVDQVYKECEECQNTAVYRIDSCSIKPSDPQEPVTYYITLEDTSFVFEEGRIYQFTDGLPIEGCFTFEGIYYNREADYTGLATPYTYPEGMDCWLCYPHCLAFQNCKDESNMVYVRLDRASPRPQPFDDIGHVYELAGDSSVIDKCWIYMGPIQCFEYGIISGITIVKDYNCEYCAMCDVIVYHLWNCNNTKAALIMYWSRDAEPLIEGPNHSYIFSYDPDTCYRVYQVDDKCIEEPLPVLNESNIIAEFNNCAECLEYFEEECYNVRDCETGIIYGIPEEVAIFSGVADYVGCVIQWTDSKDNIFCGKVGTYVCIDEEYPMIEQSQDFVIQTSFTNCVDCLATEPEPEPEESFQFPNRKINPGYSVPDCTPASNTTDCCSDADGCDCNS